MQLSVVTRLSICLAALAAIAASPGDYSFGRRMPTASHESHENGRFFGTRTRKATTSTTVTPETVEDPLRSSVETAVVNEFIHANCRRQEQEERRLFAPRAALSDTVANDWVEMTDSAELPISPPASKIARRFNRDPCSVEKIRQQACAIWHKRDRGHIKLASFSLNNGLMSDTRKNPLFLVFEICHGNISLTREERCEIAEAFYNIQLVTYSISVVLVDSISFKEKKVNYYCLNTGNDCDKLDERCKYLHNPRNQPVLRSVNHKKNVSPAWYNRTCPFRSRGFAPASYVKLENRASSFENYIRQLNDHYQPLKKKLQIFARFSKTQANRNNNQSLAGRALPKSCRNVTLHDATRTIKFDSQLPAYLKQPPLARNLVQENCSVESQNLARQLLEMNQNGTIWLSWFVYDEIFGESVVVDGYKAAPLFTINYAAHGLKAPMPWISNNSNVQNVCIPAKTLRNLVNTASLFYGSNTESVYVQSLVGWENYADTGKKHHSSQVIGVDMQCGDALYNQELGGNCYEMVEICYKGNFKQAITPGYLIGCGQSDWAVSIIHCAN